MTRSFAEGKLSRRGLCVFLAASAIAAAVPGAAAQDYPVRPVRLIVPFPPGGATDVIGRILAQRLSADWGQQVVVENRPGSAGILGGEFVAKANADGHTLLFTALGGVNSALLGKLAPIALAATPPNIMVVNSKVKAKTFEEFLALARANPGTLNFASSGPGSLSHLSAELLKSMAKIDVRHVPYKGMGQAINDLLGNHVQFGMVPLPVAAGHLKSGNLVAIAVSSAERLPALPNVPTVSEGGISGYAAINWFGMFAPSATPEAVLTKINADVNQALKLPEVKEQFAKIGFEPLGGSADEFLRYLQTDIPKWEKVAKEVGVQ